MKRIDERLATLDKNQKEIMEQIEVMGDKIDRVIGD
jgi:chaperonin cofactor prefoldin